MKKLLLPFIILISLNIDCFAQTAGKIKPLKNTDSRSADVSADNWSARARQYIDRSNYFFKPDNGNYATANTKQSLLYDVTPGCLRVSPAAHGTGFAWSSITLRGINKGCNDLISAGEISHTQKDNDLTYDFGAYRIDYHNDESGLRQNFIIAKSPSGHQPLSVELDITGDLNASLVNGNSLSLTACGDSKKVLRYDGLAVWDARNKKLDAHMALVNNHLLVISVNDADAVYPVTVDPLTHSSDWSGSAEGLLPTLLTDLQLQTEALYGFRVTGLGDINGDGYDDAAISAPGAIDIIAGPSTLVNVGAVFIYFGSDTGLSVQPDRVLRPNTPIANALFGLSVAAGNVTGNSKRDIIIGAPGESYTASTGGNASTASVMAGKVYVYDGDNITNNILNTPASLFLDGSLYFSTGDVFGAGANITTNALFGFSVAATEDMDGDGLGEVVVGSPGYANAALLIVRTGAAFVYRSGKISANEPARLDAPTLLNFPAGVNLNGLLFGFSVDGAGDFNKDLIPDVIVGAPGGVNLGLPGFLGGSAYVYFGNGTTIYNHAFNTQLSDGGGLLSSTANLFGMEVKGLSDAAGLRNGNILVGSPVSEVLHNSLGLNVKAGALNIFTAKSSPAATIIPDQRFSTPRGTSILAILSGQTIDANILTGFSADNAQDVNCDGYGDIIVGEPLSTGIGMIGANAVGGAAYIFTGKPDGTFNTTPYWSLENNVSFDFGINAGSMLGADVAGIGHTRGALQGINVMAGAPGAALDYSTGIFNLGTTLRTTSDFVAGDNGLGKAYSFVFNTCSVLAVNTVYFSAAEKNCDALLNWQLTNAGNLSHILIEKSSDGIHFSPVQAVSKKDDGIYRATVNQQGKTAWYRLNYIQTNGVSVYSDIKPVSITCGNAPDLIEAYPTLFSGDVKVIYTAEANKGKALLTVTDVYGRTLISKTTDINAGQNQLTINGSAMAPGMYYVRITGESFKSETVKIIRN